MPQELSTFTHPHLRKLDQDARQNAELVRALFSSLSEAQLTWKPDSKTWSVAECIEHLVITDKLYMPNLISVMGESERGSTNASKPYKPGLFARQFLKAAGENGKIKVKTFTAFNPLQASQGGDVGSGERFLAGQQRLLELLREADGLPLNGKKLPSPANKLIRFTLGEAFTLLVSHQRRHINQAERLKGREGFPKSEL